MNGILTMPSTPRFRTGRFGLRSNTVTFVSPLSGATQTLELPGTKWLATYELPPMFRAEAEEWLAFLASLNGRAGRFYAGDPNGIVPRGVGGGTPVVAGANQRGRTLTVSGFSGSNPVLLKGDYVAWDTPTGWRELHKLTADAPTLGVGGYDEGGYDIGGYGGGGSTELAITPAIRESPADGATLILANASCVMMLAQDDSAMWDINEATNYGIKFNAEEVFIANVSLVS